MIETARPGFRDLLAAIVLLLGTIAAYAGVTGHDFVFYDDNAYVFENPMVNGGLTVEGVEWAFTSSHSSNWHPLTWLSHMLDCELYGIEGNAAGKHHRTNLILHALNALLLFGFLRAVRGGLWPSLAVALLFALHPLRVESVAWVAERKDVLSGFFWMTTLLAYAWYARRPAGRRYALVFLSLALGLMAKPMLVTLPFVLLLLDAWPLRRFSSGATVDGRPSPFAVRSAKVLVLEKVPLLLLVVASSVTTALVQHQSGVIRSAEALSLAARIANACTSYVAYLGKTVWPTDLAFFHPHPAIYRPEEFSPFGAAVIGSVLLLAAISFAAVRYHRRWPFLAVGWFWYLGALVPVIGLLQVGEQAYAERYAYLPLIGIYLALVWGLAALVEGRPALRVPVLAAGAVVLVACGFVTRAQTRHWHDSVALFEHAIAVTESNYLAHVNLGYYHWRRGRKAEALAQYELAEAIKPDDPRVNFNLGLVHQAIAEPAEAIKRFKAVLRAVPENAEVHRLLGALYAGQTRNALALEHFREAVRLAPDFAENHSNLGRMHRLLNNPGAAASELREALRLKPELAGERLDLAECLEELGDHAGAVQQYRAVLESAPTSAPVALKLAWLLATSRDDAVRNGVEALSIARSLADAGVPRHTDTLNVLAAALAETGNFDEAVRSQREALGLAAPDLQVEYQGRLEQYLSQRPVRE